MSKICSFCKEKLPSLESCTCTTLRYLGDPISRIPFGDEEYDWGTSRCGCCGTHRGGYHHENCSREFCPLCGELLHICDCEEFFST